MATKAPTGLSIARDGLNFVLSWKLGAKYKAQQVQYDIGSGWVSFPSVGKGDTTKTLTVSGTAVLKFVRFQVRGKKSGWSAWTSQEFALSAPLKPFVGNTPTSGVDGETTFTWSLESTDNDSSPFSGIEWQSVLVPNCDYTNGELAPWNGAAVNNSASTEGSWTKSDLSSIVQGNSYTRWFRARSKGIGGYSEWDYSKVVYAQPEKAVIKSIETTPIANGYTVSVTWDVPSSPSRPIDECYVEYAYVVPAAGMTLPSGFNSWSQTDGVRDSEGEDKLVFDTDGLLADDQCLFVRVVSAFREKTNPSDPQIAKVGYLANTGAISILETNPTLHRVRLSVQNNSTVPDSATAITFSTAANPSKAQILGIIAHGQTTITIQCPDWGTDEFIVGAYAFVGSSTSNTVDGVTTYAVDSKMKSKNTVHEGGDVPLPPSNVIATAIAEDKVRVTWAWAWEEANEAEISWSDHSDAWESTDGPESYIISNVQASQWIIAGLESGKTWYVRVRLIKTGQDTETVGAWSDLNENSTVDLSSAPMTPVLTLSDGVITADETVTAYWAYVSTDGTLQTYAEICEASIVNGAIVYGDIIAHTETAHSIDIVASEVGWVAGETHLLCVRVQSASGKKSENWSTPVSVIVAEELEAEITQTSLVTQTLENTREVQSLTGMPLTVTVEGAGVSGTTTVIIERADSYDMERPDERKINGHKGETIALASTRGENQISIGVSDLIGRLDDGAKYNLIAIVQDNMGQMSIAQINNFEVHWSHQAITPSAQVVSDQNALVAEITPIAPQGALVSDVADIYRLSIDKPQLIVEGAVFGTTYVDPYPALGEMGGYRVVMRTANGDYITEDNELAWVDIPAGIENADLLNVIDFDGKQVKFYYDTDYSNTWTKDFEETQYLGGSIQGDWNPAVSRTNNISSKGITVLDQDMLQDVRRLAEYPGLCHIRTADGSSYSGNVEVSEDRVHDDQEMVVNYSLATTRVDSEELDGMTLEQYEEGDEEE